MSAACATVVLAAALVTPIEYAFEYRSFVKSVLFAAGSIESLDYPERIADARRWAPCRPKLHGRIRKPLVAL